MNFGIASLVGRMVGSVRVVREGRRRVRVRRLAVHLVGRWPIPTRRGPNSGWSIDIRGYRKGHLRVAMERRIRRGSRI